MTCSNYEVFDCNKDTQIIKILKKYVHKELTNEERCKFLVQLMLAVYSMMDCNSHQMDKHEWILWRKLQETIAKIVRYYESLGFEIPEH